MTDEPDDIGPGHNNPPETEEDRLSRINPEKLVESDKVVLTVLGMNYQALFDRRDELLADIAGWIEDHTPPPAKGESPGEPVVGDEQDLRDTSDKVRQVRDFLSKEVEATRKKVTKPLDAARKVIQKFFVKDLTETLEVALRPVWDAQSLALVEKEARERARLKEEALAKALLANRLAIQARRATGAVEKETLLEKAIEVEDEAERLEKAAAASVAELTRTRTDMEVVTGLSVHWRFKVENLMDLLQAIVSGRQDLLPCVKIDEVYVNSLIRPKDGVRKLPGLHIYEESKAR